MAGREGEPPSSTTSRTTCLACGTNFTSRTRLFRHLQETDHGTQATAAAAAAAVDVSVDRRCRPAATVASTDQHGEPLTTTSTASTHDSSHHIRRTGESFERFYQLQALCSAPIHRRRPTTPINKEEENTAWTAILHRFDTALPIAARVSSSSAVGGLCHALVRAVSGDAGKNHILGNANHTSTCPSQSRFIVFSKNGLDPRTGRLLAASQELGALIRQELCSALPPLLLMDLLQPTTTTTNNNNTTTTHPTVLADMCAAPGSKTLQLLDLLYQQQQQQQTHTPMIIVPRSVVVANEISRSRLLDLNRRSRRLPRSHLLTICQDASHFPGIRRRTPAGGPCGYKQKYNGVLCDVPCSGDGTGRKAPKVCGTAWTVQEGLSLHYLQLKILLRGLQLLQPGGVCIYSTCSLNPIENEAVVKTVLERFGLDNIEVIDLPLWFVEQVKPRQGLEQWVVPGSKFGKQQQQQATTTANATGPNYSLVYDQFEDVPWEEQHRSVQVSSDMDQPHGSEKVKRNRGKGMLVPTMFPPTDPQLIPHLKRCGRVMPSETFDSGGFFVAALRRKNSGELPSMKKTTSHHVQPPNPSKLSPENNNDDDDDADDILNPSLVPMDGTKKRPFINIDDADLTSVEPIAKDPTNKNDKDGNTGHREGDWICFLCQTNNFAYRGRCFHCRKGKKPQERKEKGKMVPFEPLLQRFHPNNVTNHETGMSSSPYSSGNAPLLIASFCEYFGLLIDTEPATVAGVLRFPVESVCVLTRKQGRRVLVLASEALSDLAIGRSWASVSEAGLYLADHMPERNKDKDGNDKERISGIEEDLSLKSWKLYDEVTFLLAQCATRQVIHLDADLLRSALVEALANPPEGTTEIEKSRIVNTFGIPTKIRSSDNDDDDKIPWWQTEAFTALIAKGVEPGWVILVCDCSTTLSTTADHEDADNPSAAIISGVLSFAAILRQDGSIHIQASHRVVAAYLVVLEEYLLSMTNPVMDSLK